MPSGGSYFNDFREKKHTKVQLKLIGMA